MFPTIRRVSRGHLDKAAADKLSYVATWRKLINLHLTDVILTSFTNGEIVIGPNRMSFEAMTELVKPIIGTEEDFDKKIEELMNEGRTTIRPKDRPDSEIAIAMYRSS